MGNVETGKLGEQLAYHHLRSLNYRILDMNARTKYGEIDIIAAIDNFVHFVEVKTRVGVGYGKPYEAIHYYKFQHMLRSAQVYALQNGLSGHKLSLDVISIVLRPDRTVLDIRFYENITK